MRTAHVSLNSTKELMIVFKLLSLYTHCFLQFTFFHISLSICYLPVSFLFVLFSAWILELYLIRAYVRVGTKISVVELINVALAAE